MQRFWAFYAELLFYRQQPTAEEYARLTEAFEELFLTVTGYDALDKRIAKRRPELVEGYKAKKGPLLIVLDHPEIPASFHVELAVVGAGGLGSGTARDRSDAGPGTR